MISVTSALGEIPMVVFAVEGSLRLRSEANSRSSASIASSECVQMDEFGGCLKIQMLYPPGKSSKSAWMPEFTH
jgi:hypothetical protein